eukprot:gene5520-5610_t
MFGGKFPGVSGFENQNEDASEQITSKAFQGKAGKAMGLKSSKSNWRAKGVKHGKGGKGPKDAAAGGNFKQPVKSENKENEGEEGATNFGKSGKAGKASKGAFVNQGEAAQELGSEAQKGLAGVATKEYGPSSAEEWADVGYGYRCVYGTAIHGKADLLLSTGKSFGGGFTRMRCLRECSRNLECRSFVFTNVNGYCELWSQTAGTTVWPGSTFCVNEEAKLDSPSLVAPVVASRNGNILETSTPQPAQSQETTVQETTAAPTKPTFSSATTTKYVGLTWPANFWESIARNSNPITKRVPTTSAATTANAATLGGSVMEQGESTSSTAAPAEPTPAAGAEAMEQGESTSSTAAPAEPTPAAGAEAMEQGESSTSSTAAPAAAVPTSSSSSTAAPAAADPTSSSSSTAAPAAADPTSSSSSTAAPAAADPTSSSSSTAAPYTTSSEQWVATKDMEAEIGDFMLLESKEVSAASSCGFSLYEIGEGQNTGWGGAFTCTGEPMVSNFNVDVSVGFTEQKCAVVTGLPEHNTGQKVGHDQDLYVTLHASCLSSKDAVQKWRVCSWRPDPSSILCRAVGMPCCTYVSNMVADDIQESCVDYIPGQCNIILGFDGVSTKKYGMQLHECLGNPPYNPMCSIQSGEYTASAGGNESPSSSKMANVNILAGIALIAIGVALRLRRRRQSAAAVTAADGVETDEDVEEPGMKTYLLESPLRRYGSLLDYKPATAKVAEDKTASTLIFKEYD